MKNLKSLKKFQEERLELTPAQQKTIIGKAAETSRLETTSNGPKGDCIRYAKQDNQFFQDIDDNEFKGVVLAGVDAAHCHF